MREASQRSSFSQRLRVTTGAIIVDQLFRAASAAGRLHPLARPARHQVEVIPNLPYLPGGSPWHRLDLYRPTGVCGPYPVVLYVHGGGFRMLSKDTHWLMALAFARRGFLVLNISYRLAPRHPFPAAVEDVCAAYEWAVRHTPSWGGDRSRMVLAGESAGANLVASLALAACYPRREPYARRVFGTGIVPCAVLPACGLFQVTDIGRFERKKRLSRFVADRINEVSEAYLRLVHLLPPGAIDLADPLLLLERGEPPERPLPPFFLPVGTRDPLLDDTRRMKAALDRLGVPAEARFYPGELHAFHALVFRAGARRCWADAYAFLDRYVPIVR